MELVHLAFGCGRKEWRIDDDAIEGLTRAFKFRGKGEEICADEIFPADGEAVQCIRCLGNVQELAVEIVLNDALRPMLRTFVGRAQAEILLERVLKWGGA